MLDLTALGTALSLDDFVATVTGSDYAWGSSYLVVWHEGDTQAADLVFNVRNDNPDVVVFSRLFVEPDFRSKGIYTQICLVLPGFLKDAGYQVAHFGAFDDRDFYASTGWVADAENPQILTQTADAIKVTEYAEWKVNGAPEPDWHKEQGDPPAAT